MSFKYNKSNPITSYIVKKMQERKKDDTIYAIAKRIGVHNGTLYNTFNFKNAWQQCVILMRIAADLGITMEELITQNAEKYDANKEIKYWRELSMKTKIELDSLKSEYEKQNNILKKIRELMPEIPISKPRNKK